MIIKASVTDVMRNFSDYINRVAYRGERFMLTRGGKEVAELTPVAPAGRRLADLSALLESLPHLEGGEADSFARDVAEARNRADADTPRDPWAS